jgi:hypothetical protein
MKGSSLCSSASAFLVLILLSSQPVLATDPYSFVSSDNGKSLQLEERTLLQDGVQFVSRLSGEPRYVCEEGQPPRIELDGFGLTESGLGWLVPARVFWVGIPVGASVEVSEEVLERMSWGSPPDAGACPPVDGLPSRSVRVASPSWLRNQRVVRILWTPLVQGPTGTEWTKSVRIRVRYEGANSDRGRFAEEQEWERIYASSLVNYEQARVWRRRPTARQDRRGD